jgi:hypothetical protein
LWAGVELQEEDNAVLGDGWLGYIGGQQKSLAVQMFYRTTIVVYHQGNVWSPPPPPTSWLVVGDGGKVASFDLETLYLFVLVYSIHSRSVSDLAFTQFSVCVV